MKTPSPNPKGLPTRFRGLDVPFALTSAPHWSFDERRRTTARRKATGVSAKLRKLDALLG